MSALKVYSVNYMIDILANGFDFVNFDIFNQGQTMKIRSITWNWKCRSTPDNHQITKYNNVFQDIILNIFSEAQFADIVVPGVAGAPLDGNGKNILMYNPGRIEFSTFFVREILHFSLSQTNRDPVNAIQVQTCLICEVEV